MFLAVANFGKYDLTILEHENSHRIAFFAVKKKQRNYKPQCCWLHLHRH